MNCFNHPEITIVATCQDCKKGLCNECAKQFEFPICKNCNDLRFKGEKTEVNKKIANLLFASIGGGLLGICFSPLMAKIGFIFGPIIYSGWRQTNKITPNVFLYMPFIGWVIYFAVKFSISTVVGIVTAPLEIFNAVRKHFLIRKRKG